MRARKLRSEFFLPSPTVVQLSGGRDKTWNQLANLIGTAGDEENRETMPVEAFSYVPGNYVLTERFVHRKCAEVGYLVLERALY